MDDTEILLELTEAVRSDSSAPTLSTNFDPLDPVAIEIVMHEADFTVDSYMEKWKGFRDRFADPAVFDAFVFDYQMRVRKDLKRIIAAAQQFIKDEIENDDPQEGDEYEGSW